MKHFVEYIIVNRNITDKLDEIVLQNDLNVFGNWENVNNMKINSEMSLVIPLIYNKLK